MNMKRRMIYLAVLASFMAVAATNVTKRSITKYRIGFAIKNMGLTVDGSLKNPKVNKFYFDKDSLSKSSVDVSVSVSTINTGNKTRDNHLQQEEYFHAAKYPKIRMRSKRFTKDQSGRIRGYFYVTIKGVTKEVNFPVTFTQNNNETRFQGSFKLNRLDYGVGTSSLVLSDDVKVQLNIYTN